MRLDDRARIHVKEPGASKPRPLDHLSAGQQRSVVLGLQLCAERDEPLVLDQPEDHLNAGTSPGRSSATSSAPAKRWSRRNRR